MAKINLYKNTDYFEFTQPNPTEGKRCRKPECAIMAGGLRCPLEDSS